MHIFSMGFHFYRRSRRVTSCQPDREYYISFVFTSESKWGLYCRPEWYVYRLLYRLYIMILPSSFPNTAMVPLWCLYAGMICARQQYRHYTWRQPALCRALPHWLVPCPMCAKRFHRYYKRATGTNQPAL